MRKLIRTAVAAAIAVAAGIGVAEAQALKVGVAAEPYPPFSSPDASGKWVGWEVEIIDAVCAEAKLECEVTPVAWDGIIPALTTKKIDLIMSSMSITEDRKKTIDFTDKYYNTPTAIIGAKTETFDATPEGLKGKILGVQVSTVHPDYAKKHFGDQAAEIKIYQTQDEANADLAAGRIDAVEAEFDRARDLPWHRPGQGMLRHEGHCGRRRGGARPGDRRWPAQGGHRAQGQAERGDQGDPRQREV